LIDFLCALSRGCSGLAVSNCLVIG